MESSILKFNFQTLLDDQSTCNFAYMFKVGDNIIGMYFQGSISPEQILGIKKIYIPVPHFEILF